MTTSERVDAGAATRRRRTGYATVLAGQVQLEVRSFARNPRAVFFSALLPVLFLVVMGALFTGRIEGTAVPLTQLLACGIMAMGLASVCFMNLAIALSLERDDGTVRRYRATPMPASCYIVGKLVGATALAVLEVALVLVIGVLVYHLQLPADPSRWLVLLGVVLLGSASCSLLGIAYVRLVSNAKSASAIVQPPFLTLQFLSGLFFPLAALPGLFQVIGALFPLKWIAQGFRAALLPDVVAASEPAGTWEIGRTFLVLGVWTVVAGVLALLAFRRSWGAGRT